MAHIMMNRRFAATKRTLPENTATQSLEDLFFEITEGGERGAGPFYLLFHAIQNQIKGRVPPRRSSYTPLFSSRSLCSSS